MDLNIQATSEENLKVTSIPTSWSMHAVTSRTAEDSAISEIVKKYQKEMDKSAMISSFEKDIASTIHLDDIVATIGRTTNLSDNDDPNATTFPLDTRMSPVRRREATGGNLLADAMHWLLETHFHSGNNNNGSSLPLLMLAMINGGFIRGDMLYNPGSIITVWEILNELPFP